MGKSAHKLPEGKINKTTIHKLYSPGRLVINIPNVYLFFPFIFISWRLITLQYCSGFCQTLKMGVLNWPVITLYYSFSKTRYDKPIIVCL